MVQTLDDGALRFVKPDGQTFESVAPNHTHPLADWRQLPAAHDQEGIHIDQHTAVTRWRGEQMDYTIAIHSLLCRSQRANDVSAETPH